MIAVVLSLQLAFLGFSGHEMADLLGRASQHSVLRTLGDHLLKIEVSRPGDKDSEDEADADDEDDHDEADDEATDAQKEARDARKAAQDARKTAHDAQKAAQDEIRSIHLETKDGSLHLTVNRSGATPTAPLAPLAPLAPIPPVPPIAPLAPIPPVPPVPPVPPIFSDDAGDSDADDLPTFTEHAKGVPAVDVLHRIARTAGWSLTLVGVGRETIDVDLEEVAPRDALIDVLRRARCMGVLRRDKVVVVPVSDASGAGLVIESRGGRRGSGSVKLARPPSGSASTGSKSGRDIVKVFQGDLVVPSGTVLPGDAIAVWGSVEVEPGAVVQGSVAAIGGSVQVQSGGVVLGDAVSVLGETEVARGGQVLGEHVQVGLGNLRPHYHPKARTHGGAIRGLGPFGLFPTLALFALVYLLGLAALRLAPERVRAMGQVVAQNPLRSFFIGFLCWLLFVPVLVLLVISVVGIPLVPLLPIAICASIGLGIAGLALRVGERLPAGPGQAFVPPAALGMGLAALLLVSLVPWLGTPLLMLMQFVALGAAVGSRYGKALPPH
jgi:hypothetical protein